MAELRRSHMLNLIKIMRPSWKRFILALICMIMATFLCGLRLGLVIPLVEKILSDKDIATQTKSIERHGLPLPPKIEKLWKDITDKLILFQGQHSKEDLLKIIAIAFLGIIFFYGLFNYGQTYLMSYIGQRGVTELRYRLYNHFQGLSLDYFTREKTGQIISRIINDTGLIQNALSKGMGDLLLQSFYVLLYLIIMFSLHWKLAILSLIILPLIAMPINRLGRRIRRIATSLQKKTANIYSIIQETISGIRIVKAFSMEKHEAERFGRENEMVFRVTMKAQKRLAAISPLTEFFGSIGFVFVLWYGGREVIKGNIPLSYFLAFILAMASLLQPFKRLSAVHAIFQQAFSALDRVSEIFGIDSTIKEKPGAHIISNFENSIHFSNISFRYPGEKQPTLQDINLEIKTGEVVAIVGPSGVGKTTLVNLIPRFYDITDGSIKIDGMDIRDVNIKSLRDQIGIVTQEVILFNDTIIHNIAYGRRDIDREKVIEVSKAANAHDFIMALPQGYDTVVGERGVRVSGGERQRLAIARALLKDPPILILDEATSALDSVSEKLVQEALYNLMKNRTAFVIAHRLSTIRHASKIVVLKGGRIAEMGIHQQLLLKGGLYKHYYEMQFKQ